MNATRYHSDAMPSYLPLTATLIAAELVGHLIAEGYALSVHDGEAFAVKRSRDARTVCAAMGSTDADRLVVRDEAGERVGSVLLIWENGCDVLSDWSRAPGDAGEAFDALMGRQLDSITDRYG